MTILIDCFRSKCTHGPFQIRKVLGESEVLQTRSLTVDEMKIQVQFDSNGKK